MFESGQFDTFCAVTVANGLINEPMTILTMTTDADLVLLLIWSENHHKTSTTGIGKFLAWYTIHDPECEAELVDDAL